MLSSQQETPSSSFLTQCVDNSGQNSSPHRNVHDKALKGKKGTRLGDTIVASVKEAQPGGKVKKGQVVYGVVVRAAMQKGRCDGNEVKFDDNAVVLVNKQGMANTFFLFVIVFGLHGFPTRHCEPTNPRATTLLDSPDSAQGYTSFEGEERSQVRGHNSRIGGPTRQKVKKGQVVYGVVVRAVMQKSRCDGSEVKFDDNAVVLVNKQGEPIGTRVFGLVPHELRKKKHVKILSLAQHVA
ncbi:50S ribosomal protein HLP, mitochondrial-like protein [Tanacetum coccineum]|uniref:50S ribosomal protein HLP, mitochondrial-like protein n=1 Tax=Tanacetum coccineum TaxID=301880 RepID=A0ABQ5E7V3_9ASTR